LISLYFHSSTLFFPFLFHTILLLLSLFIFFSVFP